MSRCLTAAPRGESDIEIDRVFGADARRSDGPRGQKKFVVPIFRRTPRSEFACVCAVRDARHAVVRTARGLLSGGSVVGVASSDQCNIMGISLFLVCLCQLNNCNKSARGARRPEPRTCRSHTPNTRRRRRRRGRVTLL